MDPGRPRRESLRGETSGLTLAESALSAFPAQVPVIWGGGGLTQLLLLFRMSLWLLFLEGLLSGPAESSVSTWTDH